MINDLTVGKVSSQMIRFAMPLVFSNLLQTVYNMADMIVVGQFVGSAGLSAVSIGGDLLHLLTFLGMGFASAGQVILSQYVGAGERHLISRTIGTMFTLILSIAVVETILCVVFVNPMLDAVNTPAEAWQSARDYSLTCFAGLIFIYGYNMISSIMRGLGDSRRPLLFIGIAAITNLLLDLLFVAVFSWRAFGAALATVISQGLSFVWSIIYLYRRREAFGFDFKKASFKIDPDINRKLISLGLPMCLQNGAIMFSMLFVNAYINTYGVIASAVTGIGSKLGGITGVVTNSLSVAGSAMIGQSIGAQKYERVPKAITTTLIIGSAFAVLLSLVTIFFPGFVFGLFNSDPAILSMAMTYIPSAVLLFAGSALRSPFFSLINGSGYARLNLLMGIFDGVIARIGLALLLGLTFQMGIIGFWYGNALAGFVPFLIGLVYYLSGKWRKRRLF
jgi:putative MATE family efflux protein